LLLTMDALHHFFFFLPLLFVCKGDAAERVDFFNYKIEIGDGDAAFSRDAKSRLEAMINRDDSLYNNYPTRSGQASDDHMCDKVLNYVPRELTFITRYPYYRRYTHAYKIPIVSSQNVGDAAMKRACYVVRFMLADRRVLRQTLYKYQGRVGIIGRYERTTGIPEHSWLPRWWDDRARGLGGTLGTPISTGTEENLLCERQSEGGNDRYPSQDIFLHEFSHGVQEIAVRGGGIPGFYKRLEAAYYSAKRRGLWARTYSMSTPQEYFAEATQSYFWVNSYSRVPDGVRGPISTREKLRTYDPTLFKLVQEVFPCGNRVLKRCDAKAGKKMIPFKMNCDGDGKEVTIGGEGGGKPEPPKPTDKPTPEPKTPPKPKPGEKVDGGWGQWGAFGTCTKACGSGTQERSRMCDSPSPTSDGQPCVGDAKESQPCNTDACKTGECKTDTGEHCAYWKTRGYCTDPTQSAYMKDHCSTTCGCCDSKAKCSRWKNKGYCSNRQYAPYMRLHCRKACNLCT